MTKDPQAFQNSIDDERVRDHLANERTFLAWLRTGCATMGIGVVVAKLQYVLNSNYIDAGSIISAANIGITFSLIGVITILASIWFFLRTREEIRQRTYSARVHLVLAFALIVAGLGMIILWYLIRSAHLAS